MKLFGKWLKEPIAREATAFASNTQKGPVSANQQPATPPTANIGQGRKILVVDDNQIVLKSFELKLKASGFEVLTATEGAAAVSTAREEKPDLIVLDINFPPDVGSSGLQWNGFNIMQWMRRFQEVAATPVFIISSSDPALVRDKSLAAGALEFFHKPIDYPAFVSAADKAITQNRASAAPKPV